MTDLTEHFPGCIAAHGRNKNLLVLRKLVIPHKRFDGKISNYEITYLWLSCDVTSPQAYIYVQGSENTDWTKKEIQETGFDFNEPEKTPLVDCFSLS